MKHHLPRIDGRVTFSMCGTDLCMFNICAWAQCVDSVYANLSVSVGSMPDYWKLCNFFLPKCTIESMQTDDRPSAGELSKRDDRCLWRENLLEKWLDLMVSLKGSKPEVPEDIQKIHGLSISHRFRIMHNICPLASLSLADYSWLLFILTPIAIRNVLSLVGTIVFSRTPSIHQLWINPFYLITWFNRVFHILSEMPTIPIYHLNPTKWYTFYDFHILRIQQSPDCLRVPSSRSGMNEKFHGKEWVKIMLIFVCWFRASGWEQWIVSYRYRWSWSHLFD